MGVTKYIGKEDYKDLMIIFAYAVQNLRLVQHPKKNIKWGRLCLVRQLSQVLLCYCIRTDTILVKHIRMFQNRIQCVFTRVKKSKTWESMESLEEVLEEVPASLILRKNVWKLLGMILLAMVMKLCGVHRLVVSIANVAASIPLVPQLKIDIVPVVHIMSLSTRIVMMLQQRMLQLNIHLIRQPILAIRQRMFLR